MRRPSRRQPITRAVRTAVAVVMGTALAGLPSACSAGSDEPSGSLTDRVVAASTGAVPAVLTAAPAGEDGGVALPTGAVVPADAAADPGGLDSAVGQRAQTLLTDRLGGADATQDLVALRVACFARTLTRGADAPDIATATERALASSPDGETLRDRVTPLAAALQDAATSQEWSDQLTALAVCEGALDESLDEGA